jgi:DNA polymerase-3 subunit epsilon
MVDQMPEKSALADRPISVVDLETTGLDPKVCAVIEIGIVKLDPKTLAVTDSFQSLVQLDKLAKVEPQAMAVNKINTADLETAPDLASVMMKVANFIDGSVLAGHNVKFDWSFLEAAFTKSGVKCPQIDYHMIDTASLAWPLVRAKKIRGVSMKYLIEYFKLSTDNVHRALDDAKRCATLLQKFLQPEVPYVVETTVTSETAQVQPKGPPVGG